jgi:hypothetical protein
MAWWSVLCLLGGALAIPQGLPIKLKTRAAVTSRLANIHLSFDEAVEGTITFTYGSCLSESLHNAHHSIGKARQSDGSRLVWILPENSDSGGCIAAWNVDGHLVGRSKPQLLHQRHKRRERKRSCMARTKHEGS